MDSYSYRNVNDEIRYEKNMDSHSYTYVYDEEPYRLIKMYIVNSYVQKSRNQYTL